MYICIYSLNHIGDPLNLRYIRIGLFGQCNCHCLVSFERRNVIMLCCLKLSASVATLLNMQPGTSPQLVSLLVALHLLPAIDCDSDIIFDQRFICDKKGGCSCNHDVRYLGNNVFADRHRAPPRGVNERFRAACCKFCADICSSFPVWMLFHRNFVPSASPGGSLGCGVVIV